MSTGYPEEAAAATPKVQPILNRKTRRRNEYFFTHAKKLQKKTSSRRAENYKQLQQWLTEEKKLSIPEANEVFKRMLKKIFKKDLIGDAFDKALTASIRSLKHIPLEVKNES